MDDSLKGTADPHSAIAIYNGTQLLASTTADASGNWGKSRREPTQHSDMRSVLTFPALCRDDVRILQPGRIGVARSPR
jgi:hypothetical protein